MCDRSTPSGQTCLDVIGQVDAALGSVCDECHRSAEESVIEAADIFYDLAHSSEVSVDAWRRVTSVIDKAVQVLRRSRASRRASRN